MTAGALAAAYSATGEAWQRGPARIYDRLAESLVAASPVPLAGRVVLDVGAGTGSASRAIVVAGGDAIATDLAEGMLRTSAAREVVSAVADARALPFASGSLDGVVAAFSLNHVQDPHLALREATRVVRRGSPVLVSAYATDDEHPAKGAVNTAAAEQGWQAESWVDDLRAGCIPRLATVDRAEHVATEAGLVDVEVRHAEIPFPDLRVEDLVAWRCGMAQTAPFIAQLEPSARARLVARAIELLGDPPTLVRRVIFIVAVA